MQTCTAWMVVFRSVLMSLIMTFMFEPAKLQMNWASAQRNQHLPQRRPVQLGHGAGHRRTPPRSRRPVTLGDGSQMCAMRASVPWALTRYVTRHG